MVSSWKRNLAIGLAVGLAVIGYREYRANYAPWLDTDSAKATYIEVGAKTCRELRESGAVASNKGGDLRAADLERFCRCNAEGSADAINMAEGKALKAGHLLPSLDTKWDTVLQSCLAKIRGR